MNEKIVCIPSSLLPARQDERFKYLDLNYLTEDSFLLAEPTAIDTEKVEEFVKSIKVDYLLQQESILLVFINGYFQPVLSDLSLLPKGVIACDFKEARQHHADLFSQSFTFDEKKYPFATFNTSQSSNGFFFYLPDHCELSLPLHCLFLTDTTQAGLICPQYHFHLGQESKMTLCCDYQSAYSKYQHANLLNEVMAVTLESRAALKQYIIQNENEKVTRLMHTFVQQMEQSTLTYTHFSFGAALSRDELLVQLKEPNASCSVAGFYYLCHDSQCIDHHIEIHHTAQYTKSDMLYKGILKKKSRAIFNGKLHVEKDAQKILAHQANHHLLLSPQAEAYSKPELEIYADDVKCKHGASTGQIDEDALFYLCTRGITRESAMQILLRGFADEIISRVSEASIKKRLQQFLGE